MQFKKHKSSARNANKVGGKGGYVRYQLYTNEIGELYFKLVVNSEEGSHPVLLFSVKKYWERAWGIAKIVDPSGYIEGGIRYKSEDNNASGFIKAVIREIPEKILREFSAKWADEKKQRLEKGKKPEGKQ